MEQTLQRMEDEGIPTRSGTVRICGDYKHKLNTVCLVDRYPSPCIEDMFVALTGGEKFPKIDLSQAYLQLTPWQKKAGSIP